MTGPWPTKNSQVLSGFWAQPATAGIGGITTGSPVSRALDTARLNAVAVRHFVLLGRRVYARWTVRGARRSVRADPLRRLSRVGSVMADFIASMIGSPALVSAPIRRFPNWSLP